MAQKDDGQGGGGAAITSELSFDDTPQHTLAAGARERAGGARRVCQICYTISI